MALASSTDQPLFLHPCWHPSITPPHPYNSDCLDISCINLLRHCSPHCRIDHLLTTSPSLPQSLHPYIFPTHTPPVSVRMDGNRGEDQVLMNVSWPWHRPAPLYESIFSPWVISQCNVAPASHWQQYFLYIDLAVCLRHWFSLQNLSTFLVVENVMLPRVVLRLMDQLWEAPKYLFS